MLNSGTIDAYGKDYALVSNDKIPFEVSDSANVTVETASQPSMTEGGNFK